MKVCEKENMRSVPRIGLGVIVFNGNNEILLGNRLNTHREGSWEPLGGHLEFGESFEECAIREVYEETGLIIKNPQFLAITNDVFEDEEKHYLYVFMKALFPEKQSIQNKEPHKVQEWRWFPWGHLPDPLFLPLKHLKCHQAYGFKADFSEGEQKQQKFAGV